MKLIDTIAGARPNFMKIAPIIRALQVRATDGGCLRYRLVHTGQKYDTKTMVLGVPCMTLRDNTERPETVSIGTNELLGTDPAALAPALDKLFAGQWKQGSIPEKWDGKTAERIVAHLETLLCI